MTTRILLSTITIFIWLNANSQVSRSSSLFVELKKLDSTFFERGFNRCDMPYLQKTIADDLRFFHDQSGIQNREMFFANVEANLCSTPKGKPIRKLEEGSLSVFPLYNNDVLYGAIQSGIHHFYLRQTGKDDVWTSSARFTSVWIRKDTTWKLSDVLSYDHGMSEFAKNKPDEIEQLLKDNNVPALGLGVIENGKLTKVQVYGTLNKKTIAPYNTIFKVASLTKPIVALTILKLIDKGLLELDEPLYKYWIDPDIETNRWHKKLTPRIILTHQTGFHNWRYLTEQKKLSFEFEPGTGYQYSGEGFEYLRIAVENKLGKSLEELANELLFKPAGMIDTRFWWDELMDETRYAQNFDQEGNNLESKKYYKANAAANLLTTVEDYGRFLQYVVNGAELSEELYQEMIKHQVKLKNNDFFGLGWEIITGFSSGDSALLHSGRDPGVSTLAVIFPTSKNGFLLFLNGDNAMKVYEEMLTKYLYLGDELWDRR